MLEKHSTSNQSIIEYLNIYYGIKVHALTFLPLGADANALVYKADAANKSYFIKIKKGTHDDISIAIMSLLQYSGMPHIILPIKTIRGQSTQQCDGFTIMVYPFITGENGFNQALTEEQWLILGAALRKLHEIDVPASIKQRLRQETFSPKWRDSVRSLYAYIQTDRAGDSIAMKLRDFMQKNMDVINRLVDGAEELAQILQNDSHPYVLCHSDIHAGNVLIDQNNALYIVDWDAPIMAPKERDLMFIGGGVANVWNKPQEEALFYKAYGNTEINRTMLAYYRHERIVEDIAEFGQRIFHTTLSTDAKLEDYNRFKAMFEPRGVVDIAFESMEF